WRMCEWRYGSARRTGETVRVVVDVLADLFVASPSPRTSCCCCGGGVRGEGCIAAALLMSFNLVKEVPLRPLEPLLASELLRLLTAPVGPLAEIPIPLAPLLPPPSLPRMINAVSPSSLRVSATARHSN